MNNDPTERFYDMIVKQPVIKEPYEAPCVKDIIPISTVNGVDGGSNDANDNGDSDDTP